MQKNTGSIWVASVTQYFLTIIFSLTIFLFVLDAWQYNLSIPFGYFSDTVFGMSWFKTMIDTGWYLSNPALGAPDGYTMNDFPMAETFHFLIVKLLTLVSSNFAVVFNLFYILTFLSVSCTALFVYKRLGLLLPFAITASLLFTYLPYHFYHGPNHIFLSSYYDVPLVIWLAMIVAFPSPAPSTRFKKYFHRSLLFILCLLIGSSGVYYAFFGCFFILMSVLIASILQRRVTQIPKAILLVSIISMTLLANLIPHFVYDAKYGVNEVATKRHPLESEVYALKITPLLLPPLNDRIPSFADISKAYHTTSIHNAGISASLCIFGSIGFLVLLGTLLMRRPAVEDKVNTFVHIAKLNLCGVLLATMGGFGALFAYNVTPLIRCYDRMSIFIGFFSLYAFFFICQKGWESLFRHNFLRMITLWPLSGALLALGIYNQINPTFNLKYHYLPMKILIHSDKNFAEQIENTMPNGSSIFQLPYKQFPESNYENFKPYLYSHHLKWSYGAIYGRPVDAWQNKVSAMPLEQMLNNLVEAGFTGLYIDRGLYPDRGVVIESQLIKLLHQQPLISEIGEKSFFDLRKYAAQQLTRK